MNDFSINDEKSQKISVDEDAILLLSTFLLKDGKKIATSESITGGLLSSSFVDIPGSSLWFSSGLVSYSDEIKEKILGVKEKTIEKYSAVSKECAIEMARNTLSLFSSDVAISTTGYAGPTGDNVGLVYIAVATKDGLLDVKEFKYDKLLSRHDIRILTVNDAVKFVLKTVFGI